MPDPKRYDEFAGLVRLHTGQVLAYINALVLDWNNADNLFQETCLVLWQKFDEFRPGTNFLAWALHIANFKVMKFRTQESRRGAFIARLRNAFETEFVEQKLRGRGGRPCSPLRLHESFDGNRSETRDPVLRRRCGRAAGRRCNGPFAGKRPPLAAPHSEVVARLHPPRVETGGRNSPR